MPAANASGTAASAQRNFMKEQTCSCGRPTARSTCQADLQSACHKDQGVTQRLFCACPAQVVGQQRFSAAPAAHQTQSTGSEQCSVQACSRRQALCARGEKHGGGSWFAGLKSHNLCL